MEALTATIVAGSTKPIRDLNAATAAAAAPTLVTDGVAVPEGWRGLYVRVDAWSTAASGNRSHHLRVYGYVPAGQAEDGTAITIGQWYMIEDLGTTTDTDTTTAAGNFGKSYQLQIGAAYTRIATRLAATPGGNTPTCTTYIGFSG